MDSPSKKFGSPRLLPVAGVKRPAPTLLPPFEPLSSSPGLPRPLKRAREDAHTKYPTPVPTSSTGILSSSPPRVLSGRPSIQRAQSIVSEKRAPLGAVPSVDLLDNGEFVTMGRSSSSSHHQLSANRLISRVHVKARYVPAPSSLESGKVEVICNGWNGIKLHCQGRTWELGKGDTFTSETEQAEIMVDVQDARVRLHWPRKQRSESIANLSDSSWEDSPRAPRAPLGHGSPLRRRTDRIASPESPTPNNSAGNTFGSNTGLGLFDAAAGDEVQIYEDTSEPELPSLPLDDGVDPNASMCTIPVDKSLSSELSDLDDNDGENDPNEENDPIVHSFGPFGANLSNRLAAFQHNSPKMPSPVRAIVGPRAPLGAINSARALSTLAAPAAESVKHGKETVAKATTSAPAAAVAEEPVAITDPATKSGSPAPQLELPEEDVSTPTYNREIIVNHVMNQLAFSRLSSSPLSLILSNLPVEERSTITKEQLRVLIGEVECTGNIERTGKDAAGKPLECEFYYIPEKDIDMQRRNAVVQGLGRPSLRACRRQHKQYYWKRPKTP
ncbi:uncharacterized protein MKZ38_003660 [Zalerion maritima]|uniref:FHA domain-containing protein n=1 Tax=Zalerion maritima TaxID=339359 RepID=A0AAD5RME0_9PEZI|nr:uncharacterized protein MKZ38_003660 [Zalerion maritima]